MRELISAACLLALATTSLARELPFGTRLAVRRARTKTSTVPPQTFLIDWGKFSSLGRREKSLGGEYLPPPREVVQVQTDSKTEPILPQSEDPNITPIFELDPNVTPIIPDIPVEPIVTPIIPQFEVDPVITPIFPSPVTETPGGRSDPVPAGPSCRVVTTSVEEEVEENQCQQVTTTSCFNNTLNSTPADCYTTVDEDCGDVTETQTQEVCKENIVNTCENEIQNFTKNYCRFVRDEKCESGYLTELKDECQYETIYETVCTWGYLVSYQDQCNELDSSCRKVPKYPTKQCREVPRIQGQCKKVPVKRPNNNCEPVERVLCTEVPYQQLIKKCVYTNRPVCTQEQVEVVRNVCNTVEKEICTIAVTEEECQPVTENVCQTVLVPRTRIVEEEICDEVDLNDFARSTPA